MSAARQVYVGTGDAIAFGHLHVPPPDAAVDTAVLMCPPFGWDEIASYRSRRSLAAGLADAGFPTLRLDLPGTGDSPGMPSDEDLVGTWTRAVAGAAESLRELTNCNSVAAFGFGLGGLLAVHALAQDAPIDDLILWGVPARGKTLVRELSAFAGLVRSQIDEDDRVSGGSPIVAEEDDGSLQVSGYTLTAETHAALAAIDLTADAIPDCEGRRALLIDRAGISVDSRLASHMEAAGFDVELAPGPSYAAIMDHPQVRRPAFPELAVIVRWLRRRAGETGRSRQVLPDGEQAVELTVGQAVISERPFAISRPYGDLTGVLSEPVTPPRSDLVAVLLNAGAIRRIGPNRMWVEVARRWAARGVPVVRLDVRGIGDSDGDEGPYEDTGRLYADDLTEDVLAALDDLPVKSSGGFLLSGLCSGAFWALHGAIRDERVTAAIPVNIRAIVWDDTLPATRDARRVRQLVAGTGATWRKAARGVNLGRLRSLARHATLGILAGPGRRAKRREIARRTDATLADLRDSGKPCCFIFGQREELYDELDEEGRLAELNRWTNVELRRIPGSDHQLRPLASQRRAHTELDEALERILRGRAPADTPAPAGLSR